SILSPGDGEVLLSDSTFVCEDSVLITAVLQLTGSIAPAQRVCTIDGVQVTVVNDTLTAMVPSDADTKVIVANCTLTDTSGRIFTCIDTVTVFRDITPPECDFGPDNSDVVGTFMDTGSGIAAIETKDIDNGRLIVEPFQPGDKVVNFRVQRLRKDESLRFNFYIYDVCGNRFLCDPVFLTLESIGGTRKYEVRFPSVDRYLYLTNHGLQEIRIDLNGKKFTFIAGASHERLQNNTYRIPLEGTIAFDLKPSLQETGNTMIVEIDGPSGGSAELLILDISTGVDYLLEYQQNLPIAFRLLQNYPNPFNPKTSIPIDVPANWPHPVTLQIFNSTGRLIKTVLDGHIPAGRKTISWDGTDASGAQVASGLYFYRVISGDVVRMRKLILAR
ncbi:MAG: FlgD immunoglobulin-like domain containing protein, partial [bacterium]